MLHHRPIVGTINKTVLLLNEDDTLLLDLFLSAKDREAVRTILLELLTPKEKANLVERMLIAQAVLDGLTYDEITKRLGASNYLVARAKQEIIGATSQFIVTFLLSKK
jgi:uncharacterized protein YerC